MKTPGGVFQGAVCPAAPAVASPPRQAPAAGSEAGDAAVELIPPFTVGQGGHERMNLLATDKEYWREKQKNDKTLEPVASLSDTIQRREQADSA